MTKPPFFLVCFQTSVLASNAVRVLVPGKFRAGPELPLSVLVPSEYKVVDGAHLFWVKIQSRDVSEETAEDTPARVSFTDAGISLSETAEVILMVFQENLLIKKNRGGLWYHRWIYTASLPEHLRPMVQHEFPVLDVAALLVKENEHG
jgi:hypothetical protein